MADIVSPRKRSEMMAGIRGKDTKPEVMLRKALHRRGIRFRLHNKGLPGKPDIVLPKYRVVIFVHGCFWHGHENCKLFRLPKSRQDFWREKIGGNIARDKIKAGQLLEQGWRVLVVWECSMKHRVSYIDDLAVFVDKWIREGKEFYAELRLEDMTGNGQSK